LIRGLSVDGGEFWKWGEESTSFSEEKEAKRLLSVLWSGRGAVRRITDRRFLVLFFKKEHCFLSF
jgi:hypothetical protein